MEKDVDELKKLKFFDEFDDPVVEKIMNRSKIKEFKVREVIIQENQELSELYVLIEGKVVLGIHSNRRGNIHLNSIHPGQIFSWSAMFPPYLSTAYALATEPVEVLAIKADKMKQMIEEDPSFGHKFMSMIGRTLSQRLADTRFQLLNVVAQ